MQFVIDHLISKIQGNVFSIVWLNLTAPQLPKRIFCRRFNDKMYLFVAIYGPTDRGLESVIYTKIFKMNYPAQSSFKAYYAKEA